MNPGKRSVTRRHRCQCSGLKRRTVAPSGRVVFCPGHREGWRAGHRPAWVLRDGPILYVPEVTP